MIPLAVGLVGSDGRDMSLSLEDGRPVVRGVLTRDASRAQTFEFTGVQQRPVLSLNRGFSAPIKITSNVIGRGSQIPRRARLRSVQSLAGGAVAGERAADRQRGGDPRRARAARG